MRKSKEQVGKFGWQSSCINIPDLIVLDCSLGFCLSICTCKRAKLVVFWSVPCKKSTKVWPAGFLSCLFLTCIHEESSHRKFNSSTYFEKNNHPPALVQAIFLIMMIDTPLRPPSHMMKWASSSFIFKHCFHLELNGPLSALLLHT
jgi:hypothetical protein